MSNQQNEKKILGVLREAQLLVKNQKYSEAYDKIYPILPTVRRLGLREAETYTILALVKFKLNAFDEAFEFAEEVLKIQKDNPNMLKIQLQVLEHKKDESKESRQQLIDLSNYIMKNLKASDSFLQIISKFISDESFEDEKELIGNFVNSLKQLPINDAAKYLSLIPDDSDYTEYRIELTKELIAEGTQLSADDYSNLCYSLKEVGDFDACLEYSNYIPDDNADKYYFQTLFGDDPVTTAKKHMDKGKEIFKDWYNAVQNNDYPKIEKEIVLIPDFLSGYIHFLKTDAPSNLKQKVVSSILSSSSFSRSKKALFLSANILMETHDYNGCISIADKIQNISPQDGINLKLQCYLKIGKIQEAKNLISHIENVEPSLQMHFNLQMWEYEKNNEYLHSILKADDDAKYIEYKVKALFYLGEEIPKDQALQLFAKQIKLDPSNAASYLYFGKYMKQFMKEEDKAEQLIQKAMELGSNDPDIVEYKTRALLKENKLDEALQLCKQVDTDWSHFRAATILYRQSNFQECKKELQAHLRFRPDHVEAYVMLGYTCIFINSIITAINVVEDLRKLGKPCKELEQRINYINGTINISYIHSPDLKDYNIDETPLLFYPYLLRVIETIKNSYSYGRTEKCMKLIELNSPIVKYYAEKWSSLTSVLKKCGDFFIQAFLITFSTDNLNIAQKYFMKRAEVDKRGECFIDVAYTFILRNEINSAILILRRAVKAFPDNHFVWYFLGIAFAIIGKHSYARHCISVAAKIYPDSYFYAILLYIAYETKDFNMTNRLTETSLALDPGNFIVWRIRSYYDENVDNYSALLLAYENSPDQNTLKQLTNLCLRINKPEEALDYAMILGDKNYIELALEACKKFDDALNYAQDEATKQRLYKLLGKQLYINQESDLLKAIDLFNNKQYDEAGQIFMQVNNYYSILGASACALKKGQRQKAAAIIQKQIDKVEDKNEKIILDQISSNADSNSQPHFQSENHAILHRLMNKYDIETAVYKLYLAQNFDTDVIRLFLSQHLKNPQKGSEIEINLRKSLLKAAATYAKTGTRESIFLRGLVFIKVGKPKLALNQFQMLCVLSPHYIEDLMGLMNQLQFEQDSIDDNLDECGNDKNEQINDAMQHQEYEYDDYDED